MKSNPQTLTRKGFENMVESTLKTILENADNTQYNSLHAMHGRMNDVEFDNYLSKERERFLQGDVLKKYDFLKRNGLSTFEEFAFMIAHEIEKIEKEPVNWSDKWKKAAWKETDLASAYLEGVRLEGMLWATNDFRNRVFNFTFEDWKNGKWPIPEQPMVGQHTYRYGNHYRVCTLSMGEYEKIVEAQKTILQKLVDVFLKGLTDEFNRRFVDSDKEKMLLESEKEKVQKWLSDKDFSGPFNFPKPNGGIVTFSYPYKGEDKNLFPRWYDKILVQGNKAHTYIRPEDEAGQILTEPVAVIVLDKYMKFLDEWVDQSESQLPATKEVGNIETVSYFDLFRKKEDGQKALQVAQKLEIICIDNENISWNFGGKKAAILAFWQAIIAKQMANPDYVTRRIACAIIAEKFGTTVDRNIYDSMAKFIKPLKEEIIHYL